MCQLFLSSIVSSLRCKNTIVLLYFQAEVKASLNRGTVRDEKLQQTMNLTLKRLSTYQQVNDTSCPLDRNPSEDKPSRL